MPHTVDSDRQSGSQWCWAGVSLHHVGSHANQWTLLRVLRQEDIILSRQGRVNYLEFLKGLLDNAVGIILESITAYFYYTFYTILVTELLQLPALDYGTVYHHISEMWTYHTVNFGGHKTPFLFGHMGLGIVWTVLTVPFRSNLIYLLKCFFLYKYFNVYGILRLCNWCVVLFVITIFSLLDTLFFCCVDFLVIAKN